MILICDSGGTKGDWVLLSKDQDPYFFISPGFNPNSHDPEIYKNQLIEISRAFDKNDISKVYFYGAGCGTESRVKLVGDLLEEVFPNAKTEVEVDLLGSARATCGFHRGIACILGTGSNSGVFDGHRFVDQLHSIGYLAGDEGGGAYMGKLLVNAYFYRDFSESLTKAFEEYFPGKHDGILDGMYKSGAPNQFLGSFTLFISQHQDNPLIQAIIRKTFEDFISRQLSKYKEYQSIPVHCIGSIAHHFREPLKQVFMDHNILTGKIIARPLTELVHYHQKEL